MSSVDFDKIWFKKLEETDDLSAFNCDEDDDGGCDEFIHKPEEAKQYQKERHGVTYLFYISHLQLIKKWLVKTLTEHLFKTSP